MGKCDGVLYTSLRSIWEPKLAEEMEGLGIDWSLGGGFASEVGYGTLWIAQISCTNEMVAELITSCPFHSFIQPSLFIWHYWEYLTHCDITTAR